MTVPTIEAVKTTLLEEIGAKNKQTGAVRPPGQADPLPGGLRVLATRSGGE